MPCLVTIDAYHSSPVCKLEEQWTYAGVAIHHSTIRRGLLSYHLSHMVEGADVFLYVRLSRPDYSKEDGGFDSDSIVVAWARNTSCTTGKSSKPPCDLHSCRNANSVTGYLRLWKERCLR